MGLLYRLDFASGKRYVGMTDRPLSTRLSHHAGLVRSGSQFLVYRAWRKYGAPAVVVLARATGKYLKELERAAVKAYGTLAPGGYNRTPGGDGGPAGKKNGPFPKMSAAQAGNTHALGTHYQPGRRERMRRVWDSPERKAKAHSPKAIAARSLANSKRVLCVDTGVQFRSMSDAATWSGLSISGVSKVCSGNRPSVGGLTFRFV